MDLSLKLPAYTIPNEIRNLEEKCNAEIFVDELKHAKSSLKDCRKNEKQYVDTLKKCVFLEEIVELIDLEKFNKSNVRLTYTGQGREFFISKQVNLMYLQ